MALGKIVVKARPLPAGAIQERPVLRPRPAVCSSATNVVPSESERAKSGVTSSFVEPVTAR